MSLFDYPLVLEARIPFIIEAAARYRLQAWELNLTRSGCDDKGETYDVPAGLGAGYLGIVWDGSVSLTVRDDDTRSHEVTSGLGIFLFDTIAKIGLGAGASAARVAVVAVLDWDAPDPSLGLPERGKCGELPLPDFPSSGQTVIAILRQLQFWDDQNPTPNPPKPELWPRPGFFLTTIDGPQAGRQCERVPEADDDGGLDFIMLPQEQNASYSIGNGGSPLAYVLDFYVEGDDVPTRGSGGGTEPGCKIRCWGP